MNKPISPQELKARVAIGVRILSMSETLNQARDQVDIAPMFDELTGLLNKTAFLRVSQESWNVHGVHQDPSVSLPWR